MKKTKANTPLDRITARLRAALRSETKNIIEIGKLLIESRKHLEHGEWQPWLAENFNLSQRTAVRYASAHNYAAKCSASGGKMDTVSILNLSPIVLYGLAEGRYDEREEAAILAAAREGRVGNTRAEEICDALDDDADANDADDADDTDDADDADDQEDGGDEDAEVEAILDGPPPAVPPPAPNAEPIDFALRDFDQAIDTLKRLSTKSSTQFARTIHSADDLEGVEFFIRDVTKARRQITGAPPPLEKTVTIHEKEANPK
jgi:hypothetical protein